MIFLLGHKGFLGSAFARYFRQEGIEFVGIGRENYGSMAGKSCGIFINAGGSAKKRLADQDPKKDFELNPYSAFDTISDFKFRKYILISTIDVYNDVSDPKKNKEDAKIDPSRLSNYGFSKWLCEQITKKYCTDWLIVRLGGMVGEGLKKNAVYDLVENGTLYVNPGSEYQYMNTDEVARVVYMLRNRSSEVFNVCGDGTISPATLAKSLGVDLEESLYKLKREKYNINIDKIKELARIEKTHEAVMRFVGEKR